jgi:hypothetical protein
MLDEAIIRLKNMGELLIPYNYPRNDPAIESTIAVLKTTSVYVDGYEVNVHFNKSDYEDHYIESCQISGNNIPFLPLQVIIKIAKKCLGEEYLHLSERTVGGTMFWSWSVCKDKDGNALPWPYKMKVMHCSYNGFEFNKIKPGELNFH